jgi:Tol biopolymer transport system component
MARIANAKLGMGAVLLVAAAIIFPLSQPQAEATVPYTNARVNLDGSGNQANDNTSNGNGAYGASMSKDGRYVVFNSAASNLVSGDTNNKEDLFVKDKTTGSVTRVNVSSSGTQATIGWGGWEFDISADGRYVVFVSQDAHVASDTNNKLDVYMRDLQTSTTELVSVNTSGSAGNNQSGITSVDISRDGRYTVFGSVATDLVSGDTNGFEDIFVRDRKLSTTTRLSVASGGTQGNNISRSPAISCDGALVAFQSDASNLVGSDTNGQVDTFVIDRVGGDTIRNVTISGNNSSILSTAPSVSCDGSTVAFRSNASNLVASDTNAKNDVFAYDVSTEAVELVSVSSGGTQANQNSENYSLSADGRYVAFDTSASNLVSGDTNAAQDVFLHDRQAITTERVSMRSSTQQTTVDNFSPKISPDGRFITFVSSDTGLVSGDTNGFQDVFISDTGVTPCSV